MATITRAEFLKEYKPTHIAWASGAPSADIKTPTDARIRNGWAVEQPPHTYFNWHMNRCDTRLTDLEAHVAWLEKCLASQIASATK